MGSGGAGATAPARRGPDGRLAVIRYPPGERACAPWFFQRLGGTWASLKAIQQFNNVPAWASDVAYE